MVIIRFHLVPLSDCCQQPKACYMRGTINLCNKDPSEAVTYKLEILRALNTQRNKKKGVSLRETLVLPPPPQKGPKFTDVICSCEIHIQGINVVIVLRWVTLEVKYPLVQC